MIGPDDLLTLRTALLITLSILLVALLWKRFHRQVLANDMPSVLHVELIGLEPAYHPTRIYVELKAPVDVSIEIRILDQHHEAVQAWPRETLPMGRQVVERRVQDLPDGAYFLELISDTQRTVRQFRLQQA